MYAETALVFAVYGVITAACGFLRVLDVRAVDLHDLIDDLSCIFNAVEQSLESLFFSFLIFFKLQTKYDMAVSSEIFFLFLLKAPCKGERNLWSEAQ